MSITLLNDHKISQNFADYPIQAYCNWKSLLEEQLENIEGKACQNFIAGLIKIRDLIEDLPRIATVSRFLQAQTGWQLFPVQGLLESENYFNLLSHRYFPVATFLRSGVDYTYSPAPDLWHDIFGHIPLIFDPAYSSFIEYLSSQYIVRKDLQEFISRIYWYTIEAGVCDERGNRRIYGASQLSSIKEIDYALSSHPIVEPFDIDKVINCPINIEELQDQIFEIPSLEYLKEIQHEFDKKFVKF